MSEEASESECGLTAWVYQVEPKSAFALDWSLSRKFAREIVAVYRSPLNGPEDILPLRIKAAQALEDFAAGTSAVPEEKAR